MKLRRLLFATAMSSVLAPAAFANPIASGFDTSSVPVCDDCYTGAVSLGFSANFFGTTYTDTYVSNNGYVTFNSGQGIYTPTGLSASYNGQPIIAPFYADVDTRGIGTTTYGTGTYAGFSAFGVTWNNVGYYGAHTDKTDTFQVILVDRSDTGAGNFDIYYNYGSIQWETGDASGGSDGLGGVSAAVGYATGTGAAGTYDELPGSLVPGSFIDGGPYALNVGTNDGVPGQYLFEVRNGIVTPPPSTSVPEPATLALLSAGVAGIGVFRKRGRRGAR
jgi:hypothetical protein